MNYLTLFESQKQIRDTRTGEVWAEIAPFSIAQVKDLQAVSALWPRTEQCCRLIVSPGEAVAADADDDIAKAFRAWSGSGKAELQGGMRVLIEECRERDCELLVWPRIGSLVSDIPGLLSLSRQHEDVGIFLDPAALFPTGEQFRLADFVDRFAEVLRMPSVCALLLDAGTSKAMGGLAAFVPLARLALELEKPVVLHGVSLESADAIFGTGAG